MALKKAYQTDTYAKLFSRMLFFIEVLPRMHLLSFYTPYGLHAQVWWLMKQ